MFACYTLSSPLHLLPDTILSKDVQPFIQFIINASLAVVYQSNLYLKWWMSYPLNEWLQDLCLKKRCGLCWPDACQAWACMEINHCEIVHCWPLKQFILRWYQISLPNRSLLVWEGLLLGEVNQVLFGVTTVLIILVQLNQAIYALSEPESMQLEDLW